jgi:hypothetical protein
MTLSLLDPMRTGALRYSAIAPFFDRLLKL